MSEEFKIWKPIDGLGSCYYIDAVYDGMQGFSITLIDAKNTAIKVIVVFENSVEAYRASDESFRQKTLHSVSAQYATAVLGQWAFFKVLNSSYIDWLSQESFGITTSLQLQHFVFIGGNQVVDVLSTDEPIVTIF